MNHILISVCKDNDISNNKHACRAVLVGPKQATDPVCSKCRILPEHHNSFQNRTFLSIFIEQRCDKYKYWVTQKLLQITQPSQYRYAKLQYRFAVTSGSTVKTVSNDSYHISVTK